MFVDSPIASFRSTDSGSFTTLGYNAYKAGALAVGCSNHSILLFNTTDRQFAELYSSFSSQDETPPSVIQTEFGVKDLSWSAQNPSRFWHSQ